jgi:electron transfer flavoprotein beta subunit
VDDVTPRPERTGGTIIKDDGTGGSQLAEYLVSAKLI